MSNCNCIITKDELFSIINYDPKNDPKNDPDDKEVIVPDPVEPWVPEAPEMDLDDIYKDEKE